MQAPSSLADAALIERARYTGMLPDASGFCAARFERELRRRLRHARPDSVVLTGLGELAARCHVDAARILARELRWQTSERDVARWVREARQTRPAADTPQIDRAGVSRSQLLQEGDISWKTLEAVTSLLHHPWDERSRRYGEAFVSRLGLALAPRAVVQGDAASAAPLVTAAVGMLWRAESREPLIEALLRSDKPALRLLGAAAMDNPELEDSGKVSLAGRHARLRAAGWPPEDAHWMAATSMKDAGHRLFRQRHRLHALELERVRIEADPSTCLGGANRAPYRLEELEGEIRRFATELSATERELEAQATELAECWPAAGLSKEALQRLDAVFVGRGEVRELVAARLPPGPARTALLDLTIGSFADMTGVSDAANAFRTFFFRDEEEVFGAARGAARALLLRHEEDAKGTGHRTGQLVAPLIQAGERLLAQPFLAARRPAAHQAALARTACALVLCLEVVGQAPAERQPEVGRLAELAVEHAGILLRRWRNDEGASPYLDQLALMTSLLMRDSPAVDRRAAWRPDVRLAPIARACAMWSDAQAVRSDPALADALFESAAYPALHLRPGRCGYARALLLLDLALTTCRGDAAVLRQLGGLWARAAPRFARHGVDLSLGDVLQAAAAGDATALSALRADPRVRRTLTAQLA